MMAMIAMGTTTPMAMAKRRSVVLALLALGAALSGAVLPSAGLAQEEGAGEQGPASAPAKPAAEKKKDGAPEPDRFLAVAGGVVHTVSGATLDGATVLAKNGVIEAIGFALGLPEGTQTIDARGFHVYPGLVAASSAGLVGSGNPEDSTDVYGLSMVLGLAGGLTTVVDGDTAAKLTFGTLEGIVLRRNLFASIDYRSPSSRRTLLQALERVRQHERDLEAFQEAKRRGDEDAEEPDSKWIRGIYQTAQRLLRGEAVASARADDSQDLLDLAGLARTFGFRVVVSGATEGWCVAGELARAELGAVISPRDRADADAETTRPNGSSIANARTLYQHGVPFAIVPRSSRISTSGLAGRDLLHLPMEAAFAVRGGLPEEAALRAITLDAARIVGVDHRVGSIEPGKDADLIVCDGDLLSYQTHVRWTIVNGRVAYDKQKESLFEHLPLGAGDETPPPAVDHWPRRLGEEW